LTLQRLERDFGSVKGLTNNLATLKRIEAKVQGQPTDRLWLQTDVNTDPRRINARFSSEDACAFVQAAPKWHIEMTGTVVTQLESES